MIRMKMFISDPTNSPKDALMNIPVAEVEPPYSIIGHLFTVNMRHKQTHLFKDLPKIKRKLESNELAEYVGGGEGHYIKIADGEVTVEALFPPDENNPLTCTLNEADFWELVEEWRMFVKDYEQAKRDP